MPLIPQCDRCSRTPADKVTIDQNVALTSTTLNHRQMLCTVCHDALDALFMAFVSLQDLGAVKLPEAVVDTLAAAKGTPA